eukprot:m.36327 g.36327  ORF g.36327 m.36327 type:complete len:487 (-) comp12463_c0_seq2:51-1511(-)
MNRLRSFQLTESGDGWRSTRSLVDYERRKGRLPSWLTPRLMTVAVMVIFVLLVVATAATAPQRAAFPHAISECPPLSKGDSIASFRACPFESRLHHLEQSTSLRLLDLGGNKLTSVPASSYTIPRLEVMFLSDNAISELPSFAALTTLRVLSLKKNHLTRLDSNMFPSSLEQLIVTDNQLVTLPMHLPALQLRKIMATRNQLEFLPDDFGGQTRLELMRLSHNRIVSLPPGFWNLPRLAWIALAGNPILGRNDRHHAVDNMIPFEKVSLQQQLGEGTSGTVFHAHYKKESVAVKLYKTASSDGDHLDEMHIAVRVHHPDIVKVYGMFMTPHPGIVMEYLPTFTTLAEPPDVWSTLRCRYPKDLSMSYDTVLAIVAAVARALTYLHSMKIMHGDVYAHNLMVEPGTGRALLGDFGAAWSYAALPAQEHPLIEAVEVRAYGILAQELIQLCSNSERHQLQKLRSLAERCLEPVAVMRPSFVQIVHALA